MNFNSRLFASFRILLFPFSLLYGSAIIVRNYLFDKNLIKSVSFDLPVISVGNLSAGGTGKSPMVEYLLILLKDRYKLATLSRGYKRKTKGYLLANAATTALETGDEPMQFHQKFPQVAVAVGEERILAVPKLLRDRPETELIILDDAFQHRSIQAGLNILLTDFNNLFTRDFYLPMGNLRDRRSSYQRAGIIVVTKCPVQMTESTKEKVKEEIKPLPHQKIFFTTIVYGQPYHITGKTERTLTKKDTVLLITGIADPMPLKKYLLQVSCTVNQMSFSDHHIYDSGDINEIRKNFANINKDEKIIITTEKDAVRLIKFKEEISEIPLFVLPVKHRFLFEEGTQFDDNINTFIQTFLEDKR